MVRNEEILSREALATRMDRTAAIPHQLIQPYFRPDVAEQLYKEFPARSEFKPRFDRTMAMQDLAIVVDDRTSGKLGSTIAEVYRWARSPAYATFVKQVFGFTIDPNMTNMTLNTYAPRQHLAAHVDKRRGNDGEVREFTQVLHLTKGWKPEYGGEFRLGRTQDLTNPVLHVTPDFNMGVFFERTPDSWHDVSQITTEDPYRRTLTIVAQRADVVTRLYFARRLAKRVLKRTA